MIPSADPIRAWSCRGGAERDCPRAQLLPRASSVPATVSHRPLRLERRLSRSDREEAPRSARLSSKLRAAISGATSIPGPVLERDFATESGLGWNGKSTMQLSQKLGTWFFLCEIITTLALLVDKPARDLCGKCTRCIAACPTGAITAPHRLDARKCTLPHHRAQGGHSNRVPPRHR